MEPLVIIGGLVIGLVMWKFYSAQEAEYRQTHCSHGKTHPHVEVRDMRAMPCPGPSSD